MTDLADIYFVHTQHVPLRTIYVLPRQSLLEAILSNEKVLELLLQSLQAKPTKLVEQEVAATD